MTSITRRTFALGAATALASVPNVLRAQTPTKIQIGGPLTIDLVPVEYAVRNGLYRQEGLDVELVSVSSGAAASTAVVGGTYQMSKGSCIASLLAHVHGLPLTVVANGALWTPKTPFAMIVVAADSPIKSGADLSGKVAGTPALNDVNHLSLSAWIDKTGGDSKAVNVVEIPNGATADALAQGRIAVAVMYDPQLSASIAAGRVRALAPAYSAISENFAWATYSANADWAAQNRDAVRRWVRTTYAAAAYTNAHQSEMVAMVADYTQMSLDIVRKIPLPLGATSSSPALLQPAIDAAAKYKFIPASFPAKELYFT